MELGKTVPEWPRNPVVLDAITGGASIVVGCTGGGAGPGTGTGSPPILVMNGAAIIVEVCCCPMVAMLW